MTGKYEHAIPYLLGILIYVNVFHKRLTGVDNKRNFLLSKLGIGQRTLRLNLRFGARSD